MLTVARLVHVISVQKTTPNQGMDPKRHRIRSRERVRRKLLNLLGTRQVLERVATQVRRAEDIHAAGQLRLSVDTMAGPPSTTSS